MRNRKIGISPTRSRSLRIKCRFSTVLCIDFLTLMQKGDAMGSCIVGPRYDCTGDTVITKGGCVTFTRKMRPWLLSSQKTMKNDKRVLLTRIGVQCLWFGHSILEAVCSSLSSESTCTCHVGNHCHVNMPGLATITFGLMLAPKTPWFEEVV
jgi:hypothetical protein